MIFKLDSLKTFNYLNRDLAKEDQETITQTITTNVIVTSDRARIIAKTDTEEQIEIISFQEIEEVMTNMIPIKEQVILLPKIQEPYLLKASHMM